MIKNEIKVLDDISHILLRAGMYIGSVSLEDHNQFLNGKYGTYRYCTGLIKLIEETYINSIDESIRTNFEYANKISIDIKEDFINGWEVTVKDNGRGLPQNTVIDLQGNSIPGAVAAWTIPKAGGNFDDSEGRKTAGMNGMGVSLTNIFSSRFHGITSNGINEITVSCRDNLSKIDWTLNETKNPSGTVVIFSPDFSRFDCNEITETDIQILKNQIETLSVIYQKIDFSFNGQKIIGNFKKYAKSYDEFGIITENDSYLMALCRSEDGFRHISYVNSIHTKAGGTHVEFIMEELAKELIPMINKKYKIELSKSRIKECLNLIIFIKDMPNLRFDSQTKERLTSPFGEIKSHLLINFHKIAKSFMSNETILMPIIELAISRKEAQEKRNATNDLKKKQKKKIANHITANSKVVSDKILFVAEGQSAIGSLLEVRNPNIHGGYALRGKVLNTHDMSPYDIMKNKELSELAIIIGIDIESPMKYHVDDLNYGRIAALVDSDQDGNSILCLLMMFYSRWPQLFAEGRILRVVTPIYILKKKGKPSRYYYTIEEYENTTDNNTGYEVNYIKGLGSLELDDYKKTIIEDPIYEVITLDDIEKLNMAFGNDADARKVWMFKD